MLIPWWCCCSFKSPSLMRSPWGSPLTLVFSITKVQFNSLRPEKDLSHDSLLASSEKSHCWPFYDVAAASWLSFLISSPPKYQLWFLYNQSFNFNENTTSAAMEVIGTPFPHQYHCWRLNDTAAASKLALIKPQLITASPLIALPLQLRKILKHLADLRRVCYSHVLRIIINHVSMMLLQLQSYLFSDFSLSLSLFDVSL